MLALLRATALLAAAAIFAVAVERSIAEAEPVRTELISRPVDPFIGRLSLKPPSVWPADPDDAGGCPCRCPAPQPGSKVNLNLATRAELRAIPGIGAAKAERIVVYRQRHGPFRRLLDLRRVRGFGRKSVARLQTWLTVRTP